jgi:long-chain acyl-CoA synthetase
VSRPGTRPLKAAASATQPISICKMPAQEEVGVRCDARFSTYPELFGRALRATRGFHELGIGAGDRVALLLRNSIEFLEASIATVPLGASAVPINWHWRGDEIAHVLRDSGAKALVVHADLLPAIAPGVPRSLALIVVPAGPGAFEAPPPAGALLWPEWLSRSEPWAQPPETAPVSIIYTSGTTGRPKGVVRAAATDAQRESGRALLARIFQLGPSERTVIPAPMYHTAPNVYALAAAIAGMDMTIMTSFDAEEFLRIVDEHRVTVVQMVPTMFVRLLAVPERVRSRYDLSSLRWIVHAAAPCPPHVKRAMLDWLGPIVAEYYGGTETGPVTFCTSEEWLAHPGTVGRPLERAVVKVLDSNGRELPVGEAGEVYMRLEVWPDFTYAGDDEKRRAVEREGLVSCGDIGYLDADGYLYLNDRRIDMVISGGVNIYPAEIEACLLSLEGVRDCAVFGIPDDEFGEALAAHIELHEGARLTADAVRGHVRARLAPYKAPRVIEFADSLPREDSGKIFKRRLRDPYWAGRERAI